jgi:hypothetical protein
MSNKIVKQKKNISTPKMLNAVQPKLQYIYNTKPVINKTKNNNLKKNINTKK